MPTNPNSPLPPSEAPQVLLRHFPREVSEAFQRLRATGDPAALECVIYALVQDHVPSKAGAPALVLQPQTSLVADLGYDSMAISELVFFFEDLFHVTISNEEIIRVRTVGELCQFVREKLAGSRVTAA
jgi:acyl carrier protein